MDTEKAREIIEQILNAAPNATPKTTAALYLKMKQNGEPIFGPQGLSRTALMKSYRDAQIEGQRTLLGKLGSSFQGLVEKAVGPQILPMILEVLVDFDQILPVGEIGQKMVLATSKVRQDMTKACKKAMKALDTLLDDPVAFSDKEQEALRKRRDFCAGYLKVLTRRHYVDTQIAAAMYEGRIKSGESGQPGLDPLEEFVLTWTLFAPELKPGRPKDLYYKALQIVIYRIITEHSNIPTQKAKKLTAEILNACGVGKPGFVYLTAKSIDNALHSS